MDAKQTLIKLLGIPENSADDAISNAAVSFQKSMIDYKEQIDAENETLRNSAEAAESAKTAAEEALVNAQTKHTQELEKLNNTNKELTASLVDGDLIAFKDVIANEADIKAKLLNNRSETLVILKSIKKGTVTNAPERIHNSKTAGTPGDTTNPAHDLTDADAKKISNRAREMQRSLGLSHQQAFAAAKAEVSREAINA